MGACAAPQPGYHSEADPLTYVRILGPGTFTFLFTAYYALGVRSLRVRLVLLSQCLALALAVGVLSLITVPSCGVWVPN
jgi:hypothetical protein